MFCKCGILKFKPTITKYSCHQLYCLLRDPCALFTHLLSVIPNIAIGQPLTLFVYIVACPVSIMLEISLIMLYAFQPLLSQQLRWHNGPFSLLIRASYFILCSVHAQAQALSLVGLCLLCF